MEAIDAEIVEEPGTELEAVAPTAPTNLFQGATPADVLVRARETAEAFKPVVAAHAVNIQGKQHVTIEGWLTLAAMLGLSPVCTWTRKLENGWEARVEARTFDGRTVGAAEAECLRDEGRWKTADDYAIRSMAQTRASSKALASVLRFVATLAGVEGTPAEEMPQGSSGKGRDKWPPSDKQIAFLERLLREGGASGELQLTIVAYAKSELSGGRNGTLSPILDGLTEGDAQAVFDSLKADAEAWNAKQSEVPGDTSDLPEAA